MKFKKVLVLLKRSVYRAKVLEAEDARMGRLLRDGNRAVERVIPGHQDHEQTVSEVRSVLSDLGAEALYSDNIRDPSDIEGVDLVVTVGGDGTLLSASHRLGSDCPLLGINSAPDHSVGFFCVGRKHRVRETLLQALEGELSETRLARMAVEIDGKLVCSRVLNEALFCHQSPAVTSRYFLQDVDPQGRVREEEQKSSGVWVGPAAGSTAAQRSAGGEVLPLCSEDLQYVVREPYLPSDLRCLLPKGRIAPGGQLNFLCKMASGCLFIDGELKIISVGLGDKVTLRGSEFPLRVLGIDPQNRPPASRAS